MCLKVRISAISSPKFCTFRYSFHHKSKRAELAQEGRLKKLEEVAEEICKKSDFYQPFLHKIIELSKQFKSEKIEELIEKSLATDRR